MKISKRLKSLAGLITLDDKVADIGCDHALLDIYMVKNNITETEETQETEETETVWGQNQGEEKSGNGR